MFLWVLQFGLVDGFPRRPPLDIMIWWTQCSVTGNLSGLDQSAFFFKNTKVSDVRPVTQKAWHPVRSCHAFWVTLWPQEVTISAYFGRRLSLDNLKNVPNHQGLKKSKIVSPPLRKIFVLHAVLSINGDTTLWQNWVQIWGCTPIYFGI